jgi:hypothetical protein
MSDVIEPTKRARNRIFGTRATGSEWSATIHKANPAKPPNTVTQYPIHLTRFAASTVAIDVLPTEILVELTGIEPVASWLQTRRSPS